MSDSRRSVGVQRHDLAAMNETHPRERGEELKAAVERFHFIVR